MSDFSSSGQAILGIQNAPSSNLLNLLSQEDLIPGSSPSYQACKTLFSYHPLGAKMAEAPIELAQSQDRILEIPGGPEEDLIEAFQKEWKQIGSVGATTLIRNTMTLSRVYGIASIAAIEPDVDPAKPLELDTLASADLYFNILDPLNTAGSLVMEQDPNRTDFQKPNHIKVAGKTYHASRSAIVLNEQPIYIEWTTSAFGFVGRSVYQRGFYPLKSYVQTMITNNFVSEKAGMLVAKMKTPGAIVDQRTRNFFGFKREQIKGAKTYNVLSIGVDEDVQSLDLKNIKDAAEFARNCILLDIAASARMPALMLNEETFAEGFGEGTEDAKRIARYIDGVRSEMNPLYRWFDNIVMHRAWTPELFEVLKVRYPDLAKKDYTTWFYECKNAFKATWPNLLTEPDSEKAKVSGEKAKQFIAAFQVLEPACDPENRARLVTWVADNLNSMEYLVTHPLVLDEDALANFEPEQAIKEPRPVVESGHE